MRLLRIDALLQSSPLSTVKTMQVQPTMDGSIISKGDTMGSLTSHAVKAEYWMGPAKSVNALFASGAFVDLSWSDFRRTAYAVLTYGWATITWSDIIAVLANAPISVKYVWIGTPSGSSHRPLAWRPCLCNDLLPRKPPAHIASADIFCLDQNAPDRMATIDRTPAIYGGAKEYHVFGKVVATRGWCACELASARSPILHSTHDLPTNGLAHKVEMHRISSTEFRGFDLTEFSDEADRATVRNMIKTQNFSVANFDMEMTGFFRTFGI